MGTWGRSQWAHLVCTQGSPEENGLKLISLLFLRYLYVGREIISKKYRNQLVCVRDLNMLSNTGLGCQNLVCTAEYIN